MNLLVTGVGGQGIITFGRVLSDVYRKIGVRILMAETHGMSQRGGSVEVHIRIGDVLSPLIPIGGVDVIIGLELTEAIRVLRYANPNTIIITNIRMIRPALPRIKMPDPDKLLSSTKSYGLNIIALDAYKMALEAGSAMALNMVMLGALVGLHILPGDVSREEFIDVLSEMRMGEINISAFNMGFEAVKKIYRKSL